MNGERSQELLRRVAAHREQYAGQWVVLNGGELISHGTNGLVVYEAAVQQGVKCPFLVQVESPDEPPFGGMVSMPYTLSFTTLHSYEPAELGSSVPVELRSGGRLVAFTAKLDTGASFCIFQRTYGEALGFDIDYNGK